MSRPVIHRPPIHRPLIHRPLIHRPPIRPTADPPTADETVEATASVADTDRGSFVVVTVNVDPPPAGPTIYSVTVTGSPGLIAQLREAVGPGAETSVRHASAQSASDTDSVDISVTVGTDGTGQRSMQVQTSEGESQELQASAALILPGVEYMPNEPPYEVGNLWAYYHTLRREMTSSCCASRRRSTWAPTATQSR